MGGSGYFRTRAVQRCLESGKLHRAPGAPTFSYAAYAAYSSQSDAELITWARNAVHKAAKQLPREWM